MLRYSPRRQPLTRPSPTVDKQQYLDEATSFAHSEVVSEMLDTMEANYTAAWKSTPEGDIDKREHLYRMVMAVNALRDELRSAAQSDAVTAWNRRLRFKS